MASDNSLNVRQRPMNDGPLVSVVIPAHNADATLDETLRSVRSQTHRALEILVVDDGSTDGTRQLAERHGQADARVRVLTQANRGVAAARNLGWRGAASDLIAFVDADDLWAPTKIERQLQVMQGGTSDIGLVYCWFVRITDGSLLIGEVKNPSWEGDVLSRILSGNFIGHGSGVLVRREVLVSTGGFASKLRDAGAEGCEDLLFYCLAAERYHFAVVREPMIGYRQRTDSMSSDRARMMRSWMMVREEMRVRHPSHEGALLNGCRVYARWVIRDAMARDEFGQVIALWLTLCRYAPSIAIESLLVDTLVAVLITGRNRVFRRHRPPVSQAVGPLGQRFLIGDLHAAAHAGHAVQATRGADAAARAE